MNRAFATAAFVFVGTSFSQTIEPPALKVRQICGQAFAANAQIEIRRESHGDPIATAVTDDAGKFNFQNVSSGRVYLAMPGRAIQDWYPLNVVRPLAGGTCKHLLYIRPTTGSESAIIVSLKRE
jgi:hypothetical protein